jgi:hypothetical protein
MPVRGVLAAIVFSALVVPAAAQTPASAPAQGYRLHAERTVDRFVVQQWVSETNPDVSPAGFCECILVVYEAGRLVLNLGQTAGIVSVSAIADVTGDRRA